MKLAAAKLGSAFLIFASLASSPARAEISRAAELKAEAFSQLSEGIKALKEGDAKRAISLLEKVARVALNSFRAHYYLGRAYSANRQYSKAIEPLSFALELNPTHLQAHVDLGDCYLKLGDIEEALAEYQRSRAIQEGYAPAWDGIARAEEARGDDDKAVQSFKKAIELNPGFPDASLNLGDLYLRQNKLSEAVDLFLKAIDIRPDFAAAYNRLGVAYAREKLGDEAIAALRKASELEKGNPWHPYTIGVIEMDLGYLGQASRDLDAAISLDENYLEAYVAKAKLLRRLGNFDAAAALLEKARAKPSDDAALLRKIDALSAEIGTQAQQYADLKAKVDSGEATPGEYRSFSQLMAQAGDYDGAARAFQAAMQAGDAADPNAQRDQFTLGYYYLKGGSYEDAERSFQQLRRSVPGNSAVLLNLALSIQGQGKSGAAEPVLRQALDADPDNPYVLTALGDSLVTSGRNDEAARMFRKALDVGGNFEGRPRVETILKMLQGGPPRGAAGGEGE